MAKFIIDTTNNNVSKSMLEVILENELNYNVYVKEIKPIDEDELDELAYKSYNDCLCAEDGFIKGFKVGYHEAKEE